MDEELKNLLDQARQSGANESQLQGIVNAYNSKKKGPPAPAQPIPFVKNSFGSSSSGSGINPFGNYTPSPVKKTDNGGYPSLADVVANVTPQKKSYKLQTQDGVELPFDNHDPVPEGAVPDIVNNLQQKILSKTYTPQDIQLISKASGKSPDVIKTYLDKGKDAGIVVDANEHLNKVRTTLSQQMDAFNSTFGKTVGMNLNIDDLLSDVNKGSEGLQKINRLVADESKRRSDLLSDSDYSTFDEAINDKNRPYDLAIHENLKSGNLEFLKNLQDVVATNIKKQTAQEAIDKGLTSQQMGDLLQKRLDPEAYANAIQANKESGFSATDAVKSTFSGISAISNLFDWATNKKEKNVEAFNSLKGQSELDANQGLQQLIIEKRAKGILEDNPALIEEARSMAAHVKPDEEIITSYPMLMKQKMANYINQRYAEEAGIMEGTEPKGFNGRVLNAFGINQTAAKRYLTEGGFYDKAGYKDLADDVANHPTTYLADNSVFGGLGYSFLKPIISVFHTVEDVTGNRSALDRKAENIRDEAFPERLTQGVKEDISFDIGGNHFRTSVSNTLNGVANLGGYIALSTATAGLGAEAGLSKTAVERLSAWSSFGLDAVDSGLKEADKMGLTPEQSWLYAGMKGVMMAEGGRVLNKLGGVFSKEAMPEIKDANKLLSDAVVKISNKEVTGNAAKELLDGASNAWWQGIKKYGVTTAEGAAVMSAFGVGDSMLRVAFGDESVDKNAILPEAANAFFNGLLTMGVMGSLGAGKNIENAKNSTYKGMINHMVNNHDATQDILNMGLQQGIYTKPEFDQKMQILNTGIDAKRILDQTSLQTGVRLSPEQRAVWVANKTAEAVLRNEAKREGVSEEESKKYTEQADNLQKQAVETMDGLTFTKFLEPKYEVYNAYKELRDAQSEFADKPTPENETAVLAAKEKYDKAQKGELLANAPEGSTVVEPNQISEPIELSTETPKNETNQTGAPDNKEAGPTGTETTTAPAQEFSLSPEEKQKQKELSPEDKKQVAQLMGEEGFSDNPRLHQEVKDIINGVPADVRANRSASPDKQTSLPVVITKDNVDNGLPVKEWSDVARASQKVASAVVKLNPDAKVVLHQNEDSFNKAYEAAGGTGKATGFFDDGNELHINMSNANVETAFHEGAHAVFKYVFNNSPEVTDRFYNQLQKVLPPLHKSNLDKFVRDGYANESESTKKDEYVTEFFARVASGKIDLSKNVSLLDKVKNLIRSTAERFGLDPDKIGLSTANDVRAFAQKLSDAFHSGKELKATKFTTDKGDIKSRAIDLNEELDKFNDRVIPLDSNGEIKRAERKFIDRIKTKVADFIKSERKEGVANVKHLLNYDSLKKFADQIEQPISIGLIEAYNEGVTGIRLPNKNEVWLPMGSVEEPLNRLFKKKSEPLGKELKRATGSVINFTDYKLMKDMVKRAQKEFGDQQDWYVHAGDLAKGLVGESNLGEFGAMWGITSAQSTVSTNLQKTLWAMINARKVDLSTEEGAQKFHELYRTTMPNGYKPLITGAQVDKMIAFYRGSGYVSDSNIKTFVYSKLSADRGSNTFNPFSVMDTHMMRFFTAKDLRSSSATEEQIQDGLNDPKAQRAGMFVTSQIAKELGIRSDQAQSLAWFYAKKYFGGKSEKQYAGLNLFGEEDLQAMKKEDREGAIDDAYQHHRTKPLVDALNAMVQDGTFKKDEVISPAVDNSPFGYVSKSQKDIFSTYLYTDELAKIANGKYEDGSTVVNKSKTLDIPSDRVNDVMATRNDEAQQARAFKVKASRVEPDTLNNDLGGDDVISRRDRPEKERKEGQAKAKEMIKNPDTNISLILADQYNESAGLPPVTEHKFKPSDAVLQTEIAKTFNELKDVTSPDYKETDLERKIYDSYKEKYPEIIAENDIKDYKDLVVKSYAKLAEEADAQYNALTKRIKVDWHEGDKNYESSAEMLDDVHNFGHLWVFVGGDDHTLLGSNTTDKNGLTANDKFRAVHDFFGHSIEGYEFGKNGEENAWIEHSKMFSPLAQAALSSETRGQNSVVNYSGINESSLKKIADGRKLKKEGKTEEGQALINEGNNEFKFADQKSVVLPADQTDFSKYVADKPAVKSSKLPDGSEEKTIRGMRDWADNLRKHLDYTDEEIAQEFRGAGYTNEDKIRLALSDKPIVTTPPPPAEKPATETVEPTQDTTDTETSDEGADTGEGDGSIPDGIGLKATAATRAFFGLESYKKVVVADAALNSRVDKMIAKGKININDIIRRVRSGDLNMSKEETVGVMKFKSLLDAEVEANPTDENIARVEALVDANDKARSEAGAVLRLGRDDVSASFINGEGPATLADFFVQEKKVKGGRDLTPQEKEAVKTEYAELKKAKDDLQKKLDRALAENSKLRAESVLKDTKKYGKKKGNRTAEQFAQERQSIVDRIKERFKSVVGPKASAAPTDIKSSKTSDSADPAHLRDAAADINELFKVIVSDNPSLSLSEITSAIHDDIKDSIPNLTVDDVNDVIAGVYTERTKPTKSEINRKIFELKREAEVASDAAKANKQDKRLEQHKQKLRDEISKLKEKLNNGDYEKQSRKPEPVILDQEAKDLKDRLIELQYQRDARLAKEAYANRGTVQKTRDILLELLNAPRTLMASVDFSAVLRQGVIPTITHPVLASKAVVEMFKQSVSQKRFDRWLFDLRESPEYDLLKQSGLYISDPHNMRLSAKEETYMNNLVERIPYIGTWLVKGSERAYVSYLNKMRVDIFKQGAQILLDQGITIDNAPEHYKGLARWVNNMTGRGAAGSKSMELASPVLSGIFFSPRLIASRLNLLGLSDVGNAARLKKGFYGKLPAEVRRMAITDMAKFIAFGTTVLAATATLAGGNDDDEDGGVKVEFDPRSTDFGKIQVGDTRYDIWGGFQQYVRAASQFISGKVKDKNDEMHDLDDGGFMDRSRGDILMGMLRSKLAPVPSLAWDLTTGRTAVGEKVLYQWGGDKEDRDITLKDEFLSHVTPLLIQDVEKTTDEAPDYLKQFFTIGIPSIFGVGTSTYK